MSYNVESITNGLCAPRVIASGNEKIKWAADHMPIMNRIVQEYDTHHRTPLDGYVIVTSVHLEAKTAQLVRTLAHLGAEVYATGCNPLSTQDDVATALAETPHVTVFAKHNCSEDEYWDFLIKALSHRPHIIIDDGGDLVKLLHDEKYAELGERIIGGYEKTNTDPLDDHIIGGCEETTTGIHRLRALVSSGRLQFPMYDINDAYCKHLFDNHYGTGQSVIDGILRTTNLIIAGKTAVVAGYGDCGSGIAMRLRGLGAKVIITEINPIKALRANMDGYQVMKMCDAARYGDFFITATGCKDVITFRHINKMKNGAILANAGHFNVEINTKALDATVKSHVARDNIKSYTLTNGNTIYVLADGRLVNLAAADGHAAEIMDMSFSIQLLCVIDIAENWLPADHIGYHTPPDLYSVPSHIDDKVAHIALQTQGIKIDKLTKSQREYLKNGF